MSTQAVKLLIAGALFVHGIGHVAALGTLIVHKLGHGHLTGSWLPARSWLLSSLSASAATTVASLFWILSAIGFVAAASFWGILVPGDAWRQLALVSSIVSILGIVLFLGTWPTFNTLAALVMNLVVLVTQLWLHWPPQAMFGR